MNFPKQKFAEKRLVFFADELSSSFGKHEQKIQKSPEAKVDPSKNIVTESEVTARVTKINERIGKSKLSKEFQDKIRKNLSKFFTKKQKTLKRSFKKIDEKSAAKLIKIHKETLKELDTFDKQKEVAELYEMVEPIFKKKAAIEKIINLVSYRRRSGHWEKINADLAKVGVTQEQIKTLQRVLKVRQDGKMGPEAINAISAMLKSGIKVKFTRETLYKGEKLSVEAKALEEASKGKKPAGEATITTPKEIVKIEDISSAFHKVGEILNSMGVPIKVAVRIKNFKGKKSDLTAMLKSVRALQKAAGQERLDANKVRMAITEFAKGNASAGKELIDALIEPIKSKEQAESTKEAVEVSEKTKQVFVYLRTTLSKMNISFDHEKYAEVFSQKGDPESLPRLIAALETAVVTYKKNPQSFSKAHKDGITRGLRQYCVGHQDKGEATIFSVIENAELQNKEREKARELMEKSREQIGRNKAKLKNNARKIDSLIKDFEHIRNSPKHYIKKHKYLIQLRQAQLAHVDIFIDLFKVRDQFLAVTTTMEPKVKLGLLAEAGLPDTFKLQNFKFAKKKKGDEEEIVTEDDSITFSIKDNVSWEKVRSHVSKQIRYAQRDAYMQARDGHHFNEYKSVVDELSKEENEAALKESEAFRGASIEKVTLPEDQKELLKGLLKEKMDKVINGFAELQQSTASTHPAVAYAKSREFYASLHNDKTADTFPQLMGLPVTPELTAAILPARDLYHHTLELYKTRTINLSQAAMTNSVQMNKDKAVAISYINNTQEFVKHTQRTLKAAQKNGEGIGATLLARMRQQAVQMFHDPRRNRMRQLGGANFINNFKIRENDVAMPFDFAMQKNWNGMKALYQQAPEYAQSAGGIFNTLIGMEGDPDTFLGYLESMQTPLIIAGVAILGALTFGAALALAAPSALTAGFFGNLAVTSFVTGTGAFIGQQAGLAMTGNANAIDSWQKNIKMWGTSVGMQFAAGAAGTAMGIGLGKVSSILSQNSKFWGERFTSYLKAYSERLIKGVQPGQPPGNLLARTKHFFKEFSEEAFDEILEDGMEKVGRGIAGDNPLIGFIFMAVPAATKRARSNFIATNGRYVAAPGITARVSETGVIFQHDGDIDALKAFLESKGAPADLVANIDLEGNGVIEVDGLKIEVQKSKQPTALREFLSTPAGHKAAKEMGLRFNPATGNYEHGNDSPKARAAINEFFESQGYFVSGVEADGTLVFNTGPDTPPIRVTPTADVTTNLDSEIQLHGFDLDNQPESIRQLLSDYEGQELARQAGLEFNRETNSFTYTHQGGYKRFTEVLGAMGFSVRGVDAEGTLTFSNGIESIRITPNPDATPDKNPTDPDDDNTPPTDDISGIVTEHADSGGDLDDSVQELPSWMEAKTKMLLDSLKDIPSLVADSEKLEKAQQIWEEVDDELKSKAEGLHKAISAKWNEVNDYIAAKNNTEQEESIESDLSPIKDLVLSDKTKSIMVAIYMHGALLIDNLPRFAAVQKQWQSISAKVKASSKELFEKIQSGIDNIAAKIEAKMEKLESTTEESVSELLDLIPQANIREKVATLYKIIAKSGGKFTVSSAKAVVDIYKVIKGNLGPATSKVVSHIKQAIDRSLSVPSFVGGAIFQLIWEKAPELISDEQKEEHAEEIAEIEPTESYHDGKLGEKLPKGTSYRFKIGKKGKSIFLNNHEVPLTIDKDGNLVVHIQTASGATMPFTLNPGQSQILGRTQEQSPIEDSTVSRVHARIKYLGDGRIVVIDQGSSNGTRVANSTIDVQVEEEVAPVETGFRVGDQVNVLRSNRTFDNDWVVSSVAEDGSVVLWSDRAESSKSATAEQIAAWNPTGPRRIDSNTAEKIARLDQTIKNNDSVISDIILNDLPVPSSLTRSIAGEINDIERTEGFNKNQALQIKYKILIEQLETIQNFEIEQRRVEQMIGELYNGNIEADFEQGQIGNCYMLAALKSLKNDPKLMKTMLANTIRKVGKGRWEVRFLGAEELGPIVVTEKSLREWRRHKSGKMKGAKGDQILEVAYAELRARRKNKSDHLSTNEKGKYAIEGGFGHRALHDLLGPLAQKRAISSWDTGKIALADKPAAEREAINFIRTAFTNNRGQYVVTANTRAVPAGDKATFKIEGKKFYHTHAYAVVGYDPETDSVLLSNPHSSSKTISISLHGFLRGFSQVSHVRKKPLDIALKKLDSVREIGYIKAYLDNLLGTRNENISNLLGFSSNLIQDQRIINIISSQSNELVRQELERRFAGVLARSRGPVPDGQTLMGDDFGEWGSYPMAATPGESQNNPDAKVDPLNPRYDYSNPDTRKTANDKLKARLDSGELGRRAYRQEKIKLLRRAHMDLMSHIVTEAEKIADSNPNITARELYEKLVAFGTAQGLKPSKEQERMILIAVNKFIEERAVVQDIATAINNPDPVKARAAKLALLKDMNLEGIDPDQVRISTSADTVILTLEDSAYMVAWAGGENIVNKNESEMERGRRSAGFFSTRSYPNQNLDGKVVFIKASSRNPGETVIHEVQHRRFRSYFNIGIYSGIPSGSNRTETILNSDKTSVEKADLLAASGFVKVESMDQEEKAELVDDLQTLAVKRRYLKDETIAYLKGGAFQFKQSSLLGMEIEDIEFHNGTNRAKFRQEFNALTFELKRLKKLGYEPRDLYQKIQTAETINDMLERLQELTPTTLEEQQELDTLMAGMNESELSTFSSLSANIGVEVGTSLPISTAMKLKLAKEIIEDRGYKAEFDDLKGGTTDQASLSYITVLEGMDFHLSSGRIMTWDTRLELLLEHLDQLDFQTQNPEAADLVRSVRYNDMTGEEITPLDRKHMMRSHLNILNDIAIIETFDPEVAERYRNSPDYINNYTNNDELLAFEDKISEEVSRLFAPPLVEAIRTYNPEAADKALADKHTVAGAAFEALSRNIPAYNAANPAGRPEMSGKIIGKMGRQLIFFNQAGQLQLGEMRDYKSAMEVKENDQFSEVRAAFEEHTYGVDFDTEIKPKLTARIDALNAQRAEAADLPPVYRAKFEAAIDARIAKTLEDLQNPRMIRSQRTRALRLKTVRVKIDSLVELHQAFTDLRASTTPITSPDMKAHYDERINELETEKIEALTLTSRDDSGGSATRYLQATIDRAVADPQKHEAVFAEFGHLPGWDYPKRTAQLIDVQRRAANIAEVSSIFSENSELIATHGELVPGLKKLGERLEKFNELFESLKSNEDNIDQILISLSRIGGASIEGLKLEIAALQTFSTEVYPKIKDTDQEAEVTRMYKDYVTSQTSSSGKMKSYEQFKNEITEQKDHWGQRTMVNKPEGYYKARYEKYVSNNKKLSPEEFATRIKSYESAKTELSKLDAIANREGREQFADNTRQSMENFLVEEIIENGANPKELVAEIKTEHEKVKRTSRITINLHSDSLEGVFKDGEFKNYEELNDPRRDGKDIFGKEHNYGETRAIQDAALNHDSSKFIVGALSSENGFDEHTGAAPFYGHGVVELKPENVDDRVIFFEGDSMTRRKGIEDVMPNWVLRKWDDFDSRKLDREGANVSKALMEVYARRHGYTHIHTFYVEAHVFAPVTVDDISAVEYAVFPQEGPEKVEALEKTKAKLKGSGPDAPEMRITKVTENIVAKEQTQGFISSTKNLTEDNLW